MTSRIQQLHELGQSLWYDNIQRRMLENGELAALIERGDLRGMTSNPSIFNHAISKSADYDSALAPMAWAGYSAAEILDRLIIEDIRHAADLFLPVYKETSGKDGFVSIEVGPEMAYETAASLAEAHRLWDMAAHPNVMVKIPATEQGIPAIRQAIADGININITLIFSIARYLQVMEAYLSALEERVDKGLPVDQISSVASFFVSRIDSKVDQQLDEMVKAEGDKAHLAAKLMGKIAIANAKLAYEEFKKVFEGQRFERLKAKGAQLQRPLWASTSTKNPDYPDTMYVDELIGPHTVNTVPQATLDAFRDHGKVERTVDKDVDAARKQFDELASIGISIDQATQELEDEGVKAFSEAFTALLKTVEDRRKAAVRQLGFLAGPVAERVAQLEKDKIPARVFKSDPTVWTKDPAGQKEARKRMGWLFLPEKSREILPELGYFVDHIKSDQFTHALLLGMGGSSLAPEVISRVFHCSPAMSSSTDGCQGLDLSILDSTDPAQVTAVAEVSPVERTLYIVSSKSGGTAEVNAFLDYFWEHATSRAGNHAPQHFIAITDPDTSLDKLGHERDFRRVFQADPQVGGRYSALTAFGLVPAALMGIDLNRLLDRADWMARQCMPDVPAGRSPGLVLGAVIGEAALRGCDKLTLFADDMVAPFGSWLEQLTAESSGKEGKGIVPIDGEPPAPVKYYGKDRLFIYLRKDGTHDKHIERLQKANFPVLVFPFENEYDLGSEFYRWEFAIAVACAIIGVNAFDQPDVQDSKNRTVAKVDAYMKNHKLDEGEPLWYDRKISLYGKSLPEGASKESTLNDILSAFLALGKDGDYVALNAYLPRNQKMSELLCKLRVEIQKRTHLATTVGFGPRFQHSTGQLHKGGKNNGMFIQITADPVVDVTIPQQGLTFGILEKAQALGDLEALQARGRRAIRIHLSDPAALDDLVSLFS